jgi:hypothetical protein
MVSQTDFDQGGSFRPFTTLFLGSGVGSVLVPGALFPITAAGTYVLQAGTTTVTVNVAGAVTIKLPSAIFPPSAGAGAQPALCANQPVTIVDIGGFAGANPITIQPFGSEKIMGLTSLTLATPYDAVTLQPIPSAASWNMIAPD